MTLLLCLKKFSDKLKLLITVENCYKKAHRGIGKIKMLSVTYSRVVPNLFNLFLLLNTKEDISKNVCNQANLGSHSLS